MRSLRQNFVTLCAFASISLLGGPAHAQETHHSNVLIGERGMGLGGAYTAIANDASAVFYNPGGAALSSSHDLSMSVYGYYRQQVSARSSIGLAPASLWLFLGVSLHIQQA